MAKCGGDHEWNLVENWKEGLEMTEVGIAVNLKCKDCGLKGIGFYIQFAIQSEKGKVTETL